MLPSRTVAQVRGWFVSTAERLHLRRGLHRLQTCCRVGSCPLRMNVGTHSQICTAREGERCCSGKAGAAAAGQPCGHQAAAADGRLSAGHRQAGQRIDATTHSSAGVHRPGRPRSLASCRHASFTAGPTPQRCSCKLLLAAVRPKTAAMFQLASESCHVYWMYQNFRVAIAGGPPILWQSVRRHQRQRLKRSIWGQNI